MHTKYLRTLKKEKLDQHYIFALKILTPSTLTPYLNRSELEFRP